VAATEHTPDHRVAGSFRDPAGHVFRYEGNIYRAIDDACHELLRNLADQGLLGTLMRDGLLVESELVEEASLAEALAAAEPGFRHFLRHRTVPMLTWPYEWTVSMLADAALVTLDLQLRLLEAGASLKDATAYNVQFVGGRPRFIDLSSIERPQRLDVWFALGQFSQMFTFPLLLCCRAGWDLRSYFLAHLGGLDAQRVAACFGRLGRWRPGLLLDVTLPALLTRWAQRKYHKQLSQSPDPQSPIPNPSSSAQIMNLKRLRRKIAGLAAGYRPRGTWSDYRQTCSYEDAAQQAKLSLVRRFLTETRPGRVLDLGCNTGEYSRLAAECGAEVVAADADHDAVELLYRSLHATPAPITPMVVDLGNPSPGVGYMNCERAPWLARAEADCVLALALLHHLMVAGNLSLESVCDMLATLTRRDLVLEFVPNDDEMFRRLMQFRVDLFGGLTLDACREVFCERFQLLAEEPIAGTKRTLLFLRK
jgi:SAM-dependent methyltransferase